MSSTTTRADIPCLAQPDHSCRACWRALPLRVPGKAGRTREFCDDDCRAAFYALEKAQDAINLLSKRCLPGAWLEQRGRLWPALNARPWNRGVKRLRRPGQDGEGEAPPVPGPDLRVA